MPVGNLLGVLQQELREERSRILEPLLHRFAEIGQRMLSGSDVPVAILREGLGLLQEYVLKLHDVHIRQFAVAGMSEEHAQACFLPMALIEGEPERAERRLASVRVLLSGYEERPAMYRNLLGVDLRNEAVAELSWEGYEEDYARTCLPLHVTEDSLKAWRETMDSALEEFQQLRGKVTGFLERTQPLVAPPAARMLVGAIDAKDGRRASGDH
ncbi:MAG: hypothetical protein KGJ23_02020 [Euryarchaeota archaeon]|nr:hypothetical protein [Euryarchaeota archaeon]MDE1835372.1 hypothetical protein [Euryarchaeota archaeon]MDE2043668.1 hypothetical protein [Thermoplasmata archaeon]